MPLPAPQPAGQAASDTADQQTEGEPSGGVGGRDAGAAGADAAASAGSEGPRQQLAAWQPASAPGGATGLLGGSGLAAPGAAFPGLLSACPLQSSSSCVLDSRGLTWLLCRLHSRLVASALLFLSTAAVHPPWAAGRLLANRQHQTD